MRKILVMEDEDNIRAFVVLNLKRVGYDVVDVASGEAALEAFAQAGGDFDIAILDIMLPGIDGLKCAAASGNRAAASALSCSPPRARRWTRSRA